MTEGLVLEKNDIITLEIESFGAFGEGVAHAGGMAIFVPFACPGETVEAHVLSVKKGYAYAKLNKVITPSNDRREPKCKHFYKCGGCDLQHLNYDSQLSLKTSSVKETLKRVGGVEIDDIDIVGSREFDCRNKLTLPFSLDKGRVSLGFYSERSHRVVSINECPLSSWAEGVIKIFCDWANEFKIPVYDENTGRGVLRALSVRVAQDKFMFTLVTTSKKVVGIEKLSATIKNAYPDSILYLNINTRKTNVVLGEQNILIHGDNKLKSETLGVKYTLSPFSFSQVNDYIRDRLYTEVLDSLDDDTIVVDAYSGAGVMSVLVSGKESRVYVIEKIPDAVHDADETARLNDASDKITNIVGDCAIQLPKLLKDIRKTHTGSVNLILDPPRKGCDEPVLDAVRSSLPDKIVYVSCNPATLARDLKKLSTKYQIEKTKLFDMFPQTKHVETLVCLSKKTEKHINIDVEFGEGEGQLSLKKLQEELNEQKPKKKTTYKDVQTYIEEKYGFKVHTAYIAEVKRDLGLPMYDAPNAVEELKKPRQHPTAEMVEAIKDALKHFEII